MSHPGVVYDSTSVADTGRDRTDTTGVLVVSDLRLRGIGLQGLGRPSYASIPAGASLCTSASAGTPAPSSGEGRTPSSPWMPQPYPSRWSAPESKGQGRREGRAGRTGGGSGTGVPRPMCFSYNFFFDLGSPGFFSFNHCSEVWMPPARQSTPHPPSPGVHAPRPAGVDLEGLVFHAQLHLNFPRLLEVDDTLVPGQFSTGPRCGIGTAGSGEGGLRHWFRCRPGGPANGGAATTPVSDATFGRSGGRGRP